MEYRIAWLLQKSNAALVCMTLKSHSIFFNQLNSQAAIAMDLYSALAEDLETVYCFLDFQDTIESPRNMQ